MNTINLKSLVILAPVFILLAVAFALAPIPFDDWHTFRMVALGEWQMYHASGYYNPPYVALLLYPVALLPERVGFGLLSAASVISLGVTCIQRGVSPVRMGLLLASPPMVYTLLHGQIDVLILAAAIFAPSVFRPLVALAKPQCALGLLLRTPRAVWVRALALGASFYVLCALWQGALFPLDLLASARGASEVGWNVAHPFMLPLGAWVMLEGYVRDQDELFLAASPFVMPYAAPSSFIVPLFVLMRRASMAACLAVWCAAWMVVIL